MFLLKIHFFIKSVYLCETVFRIYLFFKYLQVPVRKSRGSVHIAAGKVVHFGPLQGRMNVEEKSELFYLCFSIEITFCLQIPTFPTELNTLVLARVSLVWLYRWPVLKKLITIVSLLLFILFKTLSPPLDNSMYDYYIKIVPTRVRTFIPLNTYQYSVTYKVRLLF
jgi:hypothetical protein